MTCWIALQCKSVGNTSQTLRGPRGLPPRSCMTSLVLQGRSMPGHSKEPRQGLHQAEGEAGAEAGA
eukprot:6270472-Heterocapsa_arctica.AAC.1